MTATLTDDDVLAGFRAAEASLEGHFIRSPDLAALPAIEPGSRAA